MNYAMILCILGCVLALEGGFMLLPFVVGLIYRERAALSFLYVALGCLAVGLPFALRKPKNTHFYQREGFVAVALSWIVLSVAGALPFLVSGEIASPVDALFETVSGFTTTGASILPVVETLSKCSLFWRSFTHWIGGMGVLVFMLAVLPMGGGQSMHLMRAESPGPSVGKLVPNLRKTAKILYAIYIALTFAQILLLFLGGMSLFDSLCISFGTAGTGGFGIHSTSAASYSPYSQIVITVFMVLFGMNFNLYYYLLCRHAREAREMEEPRAYLAIYGICVLLITFNIAKYGSFSENLRHAAFQVASIMTTTGFSTVDFNAWPQFSRTLLVILMFVGACAGSTGGGIKVARIQIYVKTTLKEVLHLLHPRNIKLIHFDGKSVERDVVRSANIFLISYIMIFTFSILLISLDGFDLTTNFTAVAATINDIGPGLSLVGPVGNFAFFSPFSKFVLMFDMLAGRLEIFPLLLLFSPLAWRKGT